eukprot:TRINITY_DN60956_c0_g1_i1.p1 TRINITY_DN60956_c0_g1~~TRINITY_DN60956_c0_g1_i1.p1  ORF type:complete len:741 (+),score=105.94 TRINITY_DN60956_c0_g1_i1:80-2224(+)
MFAKRSPSASMPNLQAVYDDALLEGNYESLDSDEDTASPSKLRVLASKAKRVVVKRVPVFQWLPTYNVREDLFGDIMGGMTIGTVCLAQTLAHAAIATTKPIQGPYTAFIPALVYAFMGTSPHASVSSGAISAIVIADQVKDWDDINDRTELASLLAVVSGFTLLVIGICDFSFAVRFLSQPTLSGFVSGGAILICLQQLKNLFGFDPHHFPHTESFYETIIVLVEWAPKIDITSLCLGVVFFVMLDVLTRLKKAAVDELKKGKGAAAWASFGKCLAEMKEMVVVCLGVAFGYFTRQENGDPNLLTVGSIKPGLPPFNPPWDIRAFPDLYADKGKFHSFLVGGSMIAFTTFLTTFATAQKMALKFGYPLDAAQEMLGLGSAGIAGSFFGAFSPSGSLSRTGLAADCGVKTQLGGIFCAAIVGIGLMYLTPALYYLPKTALAALILTSTKGLVDIATPRDLWRFWRPKGMGGLKRDLVIWFVAFLCTLFYGVLAGILIAVAVSIALAVADSAAPQAVVLGKVEVPGRRWRNRDDWPQSRTFPGIMVFEFRGPLSFASAEWFSEQVEEKRASEGVRTGNTITTVILCLGSVHQLDSSALCTLKNLLSEWKAQGVKCIISGAKHQVRILIEEELFQRAKLLKQTVFNLDVDDAVELARERQSKSTLTEEQERLAIQRMDRARRIQAVCRGRAPNSPRSPRSRASSTEDMRRTCSHVI